MNKKVEIVEIGPRDGYQMQKQFIPTELKKEIIDRLVRAGIRSIQVTSFVRAIPQMQDADEIARYSLEKYPDLAISGLALNGRGVENAVKTGLKEVNYVISVSEEHNLMNTKRTHDQSFGELAPMIERYPDVTFVLDLAMAFGYYTEEVTLDSMMAFLKRGYGIGLRAFNLCDSIGIADPKMVKERVDCVLKEFPDCRFDIHIHDTRNMGIINTYTAIEAGISRIQTVLGGLGGCPFAHGATGNTCTEDIVFMLNRMGYETGVDFDKLLEAAKYQLSKIDGNYSGHNIFVNLERVTVQ